MNTFTPPDPHRPAPGGRSTQSNWALGDGPAADRARVRGARVLAQQVGGMSGRALTADEWAALKVRDTVRRACLMAVSELLLLSRLG